MFGSKLPGHNTGSMTVLAYMLAYRSTNIVRIHRNIWNKLIKSVSHKLRNSHPGSRSGIAAMSQCPLCTYPRNPSIQIFPNRIRLKYSEGSQRGSMYRCRIRSHNQVCIFNSMLHCSNKFHNWVCCIESHICLWKRCKCGTKSRKLNMMTCFHCRLCSL